MRERFKKSRPKTGKERVEQLIKGKKSKSKIYIPATTGDLDFVDYVRSLKFGTSKHCRVPGPLLEATEVWDLPRRAIKLLLILHYFRDKYTNISRPGFKVIEKKFGMNASQYKRAMQDLKREGFVYQIKKPYYKHASEYLLAVNTKQVGEIKQTNLDIAKERG